MNRLTLATSLLLSVAATGCTSTSGVFGTGPGTYTVSTSASFGAGGVETAKRDAYRAATGECAKRSQSLVVDDEHPVHMTFTDGMAHMTLNFRCSSEAQ